MKNVLIECSNINKEIIRVLQQDIENASYDELEELILEKQKLINTLDSKEIDKIELKKYIIELSLIEDEQKIDKLYNERKNAIKDKIRTISKRKNANNSYNSRFNSRAHFINDKI
ncbi:MAG: hypothetical protein ACRCW0_00970 [Clostridium sp.]